MGCYPSTGAWCGEGSEPGPRKPSYTEQTSDSEDDEHAESKDDAGKDRAALLPDPAESKRSVRRLASQSPLAAASYEHSLSTCFTLPHDHVLLGKGDDGEVKLFSLAEIRDLISPEIYAAVKATQPLPDASQMAIKRLDLKETRGVRMQHLAGMLTLPPFRMCNAVVPVLASFMCNAPSMAAHEYMVMERMEETLAEFGEGLYGKRTDGPAKAPLMQEVVSLYLDGLMTIAAFHSIGISHNDVCEPNTLMQAVPKEEQGRTLVHELRVDADKTAYVAVHRGSRRAVISDFGWATLDDGSLPAQTVRDKYKSDFGAWTSMCMGFLESLMPWDAHEAWGVSVLSAMALVGQTSAINKKHRARVEQWTAAAAEAFYNAHGADADFSFAHRLVAAGPMLTQQDGTPLVVTDPARVPTASAVRLAPIRMDGDGSRMRERMKSYYQRDATCPSCLTPPGDAVSSFGTV